MVSPATLTTLLSVSTLPKPTVMPQVRAVPFSYPGGRLFSDMVGKQILGLPLDFSYSWAGVFLWLMIVSVLSALASLWPALQATQISVREALAYE
jgi:putative ABC transport system permease protein